MTVTLTPQPFGTNAVASAAAAVQRWFAAVLVQWAFPRLAAMFYSRRAPAGNFAACNGRTAGFWLSVAAGAFLGRS